MKVVIDRKSGRAYIKIKLFSNNRETFIDLINSAIYELKRERDKYATEEEKEI